MAALHEALKTLAPIDFSTIPADDDNLKFFLSEIFSEAQLLVDSVPIPVPGEETIAASVGRSRTNTTSSIASSASELFLSASRPSPPPPEVESLQKQWGNPMRLNAKENPLGISVYKLAGKDGKGAWFARHSVHEGLGFEKWKKGLQREFPETMKVQGGPGEGNIRGIGGERRVELRVVEGVGNMEVYHLSAQFPGPTTPRDFVTLLLTSDSALNNNCGGLSENKEIPRHFMVVSKPCIHPDCLERDGFVRGQYQSVEFIREIPVQKPPKRSASTTNLLENVHTESRSGSAALSKEAVVPDAKKSGQPGNDENIRGRESALASSLSETNSSSIVGRQRGKTISFSQSRGSDAKGEHLDVPEEELDEAEANPVEWIMLTRSDPGGSVPRFMVERGTPSSIVADAGKFLNWASSVAADDLQDEMPQPSTSDVKPESQGRKSRDGPLYNYQTNGHLAGIEGLGDPPPREISYEGKKPGKEGSGESAGIGGIYGIFTGAVGTAGAIVAAHTPAMIVNHLPGHISESAEGNLESPHTVRQISMSSIGSASPAGSFVSASEGNGDQSPAASVGNLSNNSASSFVRNRGDSAQEKELQKLEDRKRKLDERLAKTREREISKKSEDSEREAQAIAKAEEKHQREVAKQEEKYRKEMARLEAKREKDEKKAAEKRQKALEKDDKTRLSRELEEAKAERDILKVERDLLRKTMGDLQAENTALAARLGRLGSAGEQVLREVKEEVSGGGRLRASSIKGLASSKPSSLRSVETGSSLKENTPPSN